MPRGRRKEEFGLSLRQGRWCWRGPRDLISRAGCWDHRAVAGLRVFSWFGTKGALVPRSSPHQVQLPNFTGERMNKPSCVVRALAWEERLEVPQHLASHTCVPRAGNAFSNGSQFAKTPALLRPQLHSILLSFYNLTFQLYLRIIKFYFDFRPKWCSKLTLEFLSIENPGQGSGKTKHFIHGDGGKEVIVLMMVVPITVLLVVVAVTGLAVMAVTVAVRVLDMNLNVVGKMKNQILRNAKAVILVAFPEFICLFPVIFFLSLIIPSAFLVLQIPPYFRSAYYVQYKNIYY